MGFARPLAASLFVSLACVACTGAPSTSRERPPHIVVILADDLGYHDVGFHGGPVRTPRLDALAANGARFTQFYAQSTCSPSRSALLTGRYPFRMSLQEGVISPWDRHGLPAEERTLAEALHDRGYRCAIIGKWHLGRHKRTQLPDHHGFDHHYGCYTGGTDYLAHTAWLGGLDWFRNAEPIEEQGYATDLFATEAARVIRSHDVAKPLFLYLPFTAPHAPLQAPKAECALYASEPDETRQVYCAMVTRLDTAIGTVLDALEARGMLRNTLVVFASDNGGWVDAGANNKPFRGQKGEHYEGGHRVPALMHWTGKIEAGTVVDEPMHLVDIYPTVLRLSGADHAGGATLDGRDAWPVITGEASGLHDTIPLSIGNRFVDVLRHGDWKLLRRIDGPTELYNLRDDPGETRDLSAIQPERLRDLLDRAQALRRAATTSHPANEKPKGFRPPITWAPSIDDRIR